MSVRPPIKRNSLYQQLDQDLLSRKKLKTSVFAIENTSRLSFIAGEGINSNQAIIVVDGLAYNADYTVSNNKPAMYIAYNSALEGQKVYVYSTGEVGVCDDAYTGIILLGASGTNIINEITTPSGKYIQRLGQVISTGKYTIKIENPTKIL